MACFRIFKIGELINGWKRLSCASRRYLGFSSRGWTFLDGAGSGSDFLGRKLKERRRWGREGRDGGLECRMHLRRRNREELFMLLEDRDAKDVPGQRIMADPFLAESSKTEFSSEMAGGRHVKQIASRTQKIVWSKVFFFAQMHSLQNTGQTLWLRLWNWCISEAELTWSLNKTSNHLRNGLALPNCPNLPFQMHHFQIAVDFIDYLSTKLRSTLIIQCQTISNMSVVWNGM